MALADTARLIASLELQDKFSKNAALYDRTVDRMQRRTAGLEQLGYQIGRGTGAAVHNLKLIGVAGLGVLALSVRSGLETLAKLESVTAQTNAVLESTQGVAGQTGESIRQLAEKYEGLNATIDDKVIQSSENLLLTFTNITGKAFEPALQAILDVNTAMGGGEEGLQGVAIQVGKALNDPVRGLTALRRIGVAFSDEQETAIKQLVAQNDLYGAQEIILAELTKEFGGSFAAAGDTAAGKFAKLQDAVEDAQSALTTALLPVLEKTADKLSTFLADPKVIAGIESFGGELAEGFDKVVQFAGKVPWETIGSSLQIAGRGAKAVFDAFTGLPDWIQTAVITGWGLNKLTGGALGNIGGLGIKMIFERGATPANPLWVQSVTGGVGGGAPIPGGKTGGGITGTLGNIAKWVIGPAAAAAIGNEIGRNVFFDPAVKPAVEFEQSQFQKLLANGDTGDMEHGLDAIDEGLRQLGGDTALGNLLFSDQITVLKDQKTILERKLDSLNEREAQVVTQLDRTNRTIEHTRQTALENVAAARLTAQHTANAAHFGQQALGPLNTVARKDFSPTTNVRVNVNATTNLSVSNVSRVITSYRNAVSTKLTNAGIY